MRTTLVAVLLLTTTVCSAQPARTREITNGSWNFPNLSIENWDIRQMIVAGTTDQNGAVLCPTFKFVDPNLGPIALPPLPTYRTQFSTSKVLMDFTINQNSGLLIMTGMDPLTSTAPMNMYITVVNLPNGTVMNSVQLPSTFNMIPHQVIYSPTNNHIVVVGTKTAVGLSNTNFSTIPKTGFILIVNATTLATINFIETNTPSITGGSDSDMLESVTEIPGGAGYFAGGSANGFANPAEQNMMVMRVVGGTWTPGPSCIVDNTNGRSVVASVMHNPASGRIIALDNNSSFSTYELMAFNPLTAAPAFPGVRHNLNSCIPTGTITSGFRLQQNAAGTQIIVGGYAWSPAGTALRPFQTTTNPGLTTFISAKAFQSSNTSPLTGYFNESGVPPYINTPDIVTYHPTSNRTFLVNPHTNFGFDMLRSSATATLACETGCQFTTASASWPFLMNGVAFTQSVPSLPPLSAFFVSRSLANSVLCSSTPLAPIEEETTLQATEGDIVLFPNPAKDVLEIASDRTITEVVVYDLNGGKVLEAINDQNEAGIRMLDVNSLTPGAYIMTLKDSNGDLQRMKFVKE